MRRKPYHTLKHPLLNSVVIAHEWILDQWGGVESPGFYVTKVRSHIIRNKDRLKIWWWDNSVVIWKKMILYITVFRRTNTKWVKS